VKKLLTIVLISIAILYIGLCIIVYRYQTKLMFFPDKKMIELQLDATTKSINLQTADGEILGAWYIDNGSKICVLYCHGNGGNISYLQARLPLFAALKVNAIVFDYRGYGNSTGAIEAEKDVYTDAQSAYDYIKNIGFADSNIIVWGQSLGGGVACEVAQNRSIKGLILESTFASMDAMGAEHYGWLPTSYLSKFHFASIDKLQNIHASTLVLHSPQDEVISYKNGQQLYDNANEPKKIITTKGYHNTAVQESYAQYVQEIGMYCK
jgi:uncharacterized protein